MKKRLIFTLMLAVAIMCMLAVYASATVYYYSEDDLENPIFQYETKWSPNIEIIQKIAEYYGVGFVQDYEELGNLVYGRATYRDSILSDIFLSDDDFEAYEQDEETDLYHFEGEVYESDSDILETLLEIS